MIASGALAAGTIAAGLWWLRRRYVVITVRGESMTPTYQPGDRLLVRRSGTDRVRRGTCLVFADREVHGQWLVKRAIAVPGDPVPLAQIPRLSDRSGTRVPPGHVAVLGDNPARSHDSRFFGYVRSDQVLGVVLRRMSATG